MTTLGSTFPTCFEQASVQYTTAKIFVYQTHTPSTLYSAAEYFYQLAMAYCIKETLKVEVNYISVALIHYLLRSSQRVMATPFRTEAITCHGELTLINWCQNLVYGLLHQSVYHGRNTQKAFLAIVLRD